MWLWRVNEMIDLVILILRTLHMCSCTPGWIPVVYWKGVGESNFEKDIFYCATLGPPVPGPPEDAHAPTLRNTAGFS